MPSSKFGLTHTLCDPVHTTLASAIAETELPRGAPGEAQHVPATWAGLHTVSLHLHQHRKESWVRLIRPGVAPCSPQQPKKVIQVPSGRFNALISIHPHESAMSSVPSVLLELEHYGSVVHLSKLVVNAVSRPRLYGIISLLLWHYVIVTRWTVQQWMAVEAAALCCFLELKAKQNMECVFVSIFTSYRYCCCKSLVGLSFCHFRWPPFCKMLETVLITAGNVDYCSRKPLSGGSQFRCFLASAYRRVHGADLPHAVPSRYFTLILACFVHALILLYASLLITLLRGHEEQRHYWLFCCSLFILLFSCFPDAAQLSAVKSVTTGRAYWINSPFLKSLLAVLQLAPQTWLCVALSKIHMQNCTHVGFCNIESLFYGRTISAHFRNFLNKRCGQKLLSFLSSSWGLAKKQTRLQKPSAHLISEVWLLKTSELWLESKFYSNCSFFSLLSWLKKININKTGFRSQSLYWMFWSNRKLFLKKIESCFFYCLKKGMSGTFQFLSTKFRKWKRKVCGVLI